MTNQHCQVPTLQLLLAQAHLTIHPWVVLCGIRVVPEANRFDHQEVRSAVPVRWPLARLESYHGWRHLVEGAGYPSKETNVHGVLETNEGG